MTQIMTVKGPIAPEELGFTSMHEHILLNSSVFRKKLEELALEDPPVKPEDPVSLENIGLLQRNIFLSHDAGEMSDEELMTAEVADFKAAGGAAIVDQSPPGLRSNLGAIKRISENTGVHIITTTGLYTEESWPEEFKELSQEAYAEFMLEEVANGIGDSGIKPGHIKIGISNMSYPQVALLRAAARVSNETGLSITVHPGFEIGNDGRSIARILMAAGAAPERIIIAHMDGFMPYHDIKELALHPQAWGLNLEVQKSLIEQGVTVSIDCFGHLWSMEATGLVLETDWQRLGEIVALVKEEYSSHIVLGTDTFMKILTRRGGGTGYCRLTDFVIPTLRDLGVSDYDIRLMTIENPARLLAI